MIMIGLKTEIIVPVNNYHSNDDDDAMMNVVLMVIIMIIFIIMIKSIKTKTIAYAYIFASISGIYSTSTNLSKGSL